MQLEDFYLTVDQSGEKSATAFLMGLRLLDIAENTLLCHKRRSEMVNARKCDSVCVCVGGGCEVIFRPVLR